MDMDSVDEFYTLKTELVTTALLQRPPQLLSGLLIGQGTYSVITGLCSTRGFVV